MERNGKRVSQSGTTEMLKQFSFLDYRWLDPGELMVLTKLVESWRNQLSYRVKYNMYTSPMSFDVWMGAYAQADQVKQDGICFFNDGEYRHRIYLVFGVVESSENTDWQEIENGKQNFPLNWTKLETIEVTAE